MPDGPWARQAAVGSLCVLHSRLPCLLFCGGSDNICSQWFLHHLHGEGIEFGPLCCHLCGGCPRSPPLPWRLRWPEEASTSALRCLSPAPSPPASRHCWLHRSRMCCLETNTACFVLICGKSQLSPWGEQASPGTVCPTQPQSQATLLAPCSWPPQPAPSPRWASSACCVGRSRESPPGQSLLSNLLTGRTTPWHLGLAWVPDQPSPVHPLG